MSLSSKLKQAKIAMRNAVHKITGQDKLITEYNALVSKLCYLSDSLPDSEQKSELMKNGFLNSRNVSLFSETILKDFDVKHTSSSQSMKDLSGGNAQKLIVGREYMQNTPLSIAAEPTRGIDIGAIEYMHGRLLEKRQKKDAILLISSELSEIIELSDRIYVMCSGRINGEFSRDEATREKIGYLMMGGKNDDEM